MDNKDWEAIREMMSASGGSFLSRTLFNYLSTCYKTFGNRFDALRALQDLMLHTDMLITEIEKSRLRQ